MYIVQRINEVEVVERREIADESGERANRDTAGTIVRGCFEKLRKS